MADNLIHIQFDSGTLVLTGEEGILKSLPGCRFDQRSRNFRAEGRYYRAIIEHLEKERLPYQNEAQAYDRTPWPMRVSREPFYYQAEGLETWWNRGARGVVVLPTGAGKTYLAMMAIERVGRPTLVVTPKVALMDQWCSQMQTTFDVPIGLLGGGSYDIQPLTVTTYDSAFLYLERWGSRFGFLVFDECHHLPGPSYQLAAVGSIAPFRLGLSATPERADSGEEILPDLIGPVVYRKDIHQLKGQVLADYRIERLYVHLSAEEKEKYLKARETYRGFVQRRGISMGGKKGWQRFIQASAQSQEGRNAFQAYREQKRLALAASEKMNLLGKLLEQHHRDRVLIFTYDNSTVYEISRRFLIPAITHQTKAKERQQILQKVHSGEYPFLVSSQVLNEGVDVPAAGIGIILSGTGSVREHVQRLGRILRKHGDKQAILYEVVTQDTAEEFTSDRRRQHHAYQ